jgi:hypothetical protein
MQGGSTWGRYRVTAQEINSLLILKAIEYIAIFYAGSADLLGLFAHVIFWTSDGGESRYFEGAEACSRWEFKTVSLRLLKLGQDTFTLHSVQQLKNSSSPAY